MMKESESPCQRHPFGKSPFPSYLYKQPKRAFTFKICASVAKRVRKSVPKASLREKSVPLDRGKLKAQRLDSGKLKD